MAAVCAHRRGFASAVVALVAAVALVQCRASERVPEASFGGDVLQVEVDEATGLPVSITSFHGDRERGWLARPIVFTVRRAGEDEADDDVVTTSDVLVDGERALWTLTAAASAPRFEHELALDLDVLFPGAQLFTPSQYGVMDLDAYPTFEPATYGSYDWNGGQAYVLPLVSVMDPATDEALTLALAPDQNIPHLQVSWTGARTLHLAMARRGLGDGETVAVRLVVYVHAADYRSALAAYSTDYPAWFRPPLPRGETEGTFWYHHVHEHPGFEELSRQHVRAIWSSFWFPWLGEYLPVEHEWSPYTYARWWNLREKMSDEKIHAFIDELHEHGIGTYAYFNVTEYGGRGGEHGDMAAADRVIEESLEPALVRDEEGRTITTWEGSKVIDPGRDLPYRPFLVEQAQRHLERLPELAGFMVDRLDWASRFDFARGDGLSMIGDREVTNLALPVGDAVRELCRLSHERGKRVFVNQFWRVEILRDVDGYCHENDYLPAMAYVAPFRPASAWHQRADYTGDLLAFEAQMKRRLHWALFPQLIAHEFPISQQRPDERAADLMELYAPLFEPLIGKSQVLLPHCVEVTGANDVNLFRNGEGRYVAPVSSRVRFLCRAGRTREPVEVTLRVPDLAELSWAHAYSLDGPPQRAEVVAGAKETVVRVPEHVTSTVVVIGTGGEPSLAGEADVERFGQLRERWFPNARLTANPSERPAGLEPQALELEVWGDSVGVSRPHSIVDVLVDGRKVGELREGDESFELALPAEELPHDPPSVALVPRDDGSWFLPAYAQWIARTSDGLRQRVAVWVPGDRCEAEGARGVRLPLRWCEPETLPEVTARFEGVDLNTAGAWPGEYGELGAWLPGRAQDRAASDYNVAIRQGREFVWSASAADDPRVPRDPANPDASLRAACWFDTEGVHLRVTPPDDAPYRLTLYLLDFDCAKRHQSVEIRRSRTRLDERELTAEELARGAYLSWTVTGSVDLRVKNLGGINAVLSGVFVDRAR